MRTASAKLSVPAATWAEYSPRLCPATKAGFTPFSLQDSPGGDRRSQDRGLRDFRQPQFFFRTFEAQLRQLVAESFIGLFESLPGDGIFLRQFLAHADGLRALAGKEECDVEVWSCCFRFT